MTGFAHTAWAQERLFVSNYYGGPTFSGGPVGVAVDTWNDEIFVASYALGSGGAITVYPRTASGDVAPIRKIEGPTTRLNLPQGLALALDLVHDEIIVASSAFSGANPGPGAILVFNRDDTGDAAPIRTLEGAGSGVCNPIGIFLNSLNDELVVANSGFTGCGESIATYDAEASGAQPPLRLLAGPGASNDLALPVSVAVTTAEGTTIAMKQSAPGGKISISNGDWVSGGYTLKTKVAGSLTIVASISITGPCSNGGTDTISIPLATATFTDPDDEKGWLPSNKADDPDIWQGAVKVGVTTAAICGGVGTLDARKGATFTATLYANPAQPGADVKFRFTYADPAAKGKANTNCTDPADPNRDSKDTCRAEWSGAKKFDL
jgi:hypothetical protein